MAMFDEKDKSRGIAFYTSPDLKNWTFQSRIDGYFECPEIFEMPVDGDKTRTKWVVYAADGNYSIGRFDGKTFTTESGKHQGNYGNCFYASQTFNHIPPEDGRRIQIGWGKIATPAMPFNQCMLFPCELTLRTTDEGIRMFCNPVREIENTHAKKHAWKDVVLRPDENPLAGISGDLFHIRARFKPGDAKEVGFVIRGIPVVYDVGKQELSCLKKSAPLKLADGAVRLEILVDRTSIEIFANDGRVYMPIGVIPADDDRSLRVLSTGGDARAEALEVFDLRSAWSQ
jgi:fructan beta-fructosidase